MISSTNPNRATVGWAPKTGHSGIQKVIRLTGSRSKIVFKPLPTDDPTQRRPDIELARQKLGWQPVIELEEGLRQTIEYFKSFVADEPPGDKPRGTVV